MPKTDQVRERVSKEALEITAELMTEVMKMFTKKGRDSDELIEIQNKALGKIEQLITQAKVTGAEELAEQVRAKVASAEIKNFGKVSALDCVDLALTTYKAKEGEK